MYLFGMEDTYGSSYVPLFSVEWIFTVQQRFLYQFVVVTTLWEKFDNKKSIVFVLILDKESIVNCYSFSSITDWLNLGKGGPTLLLICCICEINPWYPHNFCCQRHLHWINCFLSRKINIRNKNKPVIWQKLHVIKSAQYRLCHFIRTITLWLFYIPKLRTLLFWCFLYCCTYPLSLCTSNDRLIYLNSEL